MKIYKNREVGELPPPNTPRPKFEYPKLSKSGASCKYPEANPNKPRPLGAEVEQPEYEGNPFAEGKQKQNVEESAKLCKRKRDKFLKNR